MRSIIVTGASSGIGGALARECAAQGWRVLAVARRADRLAALAAATGCETLALDVTAAGAPERIVSHAMRAFGRIDVVAAIAGAAHPGALLEQTDAAIQAQWELHVASPLRLARAALPHVAAVSGGFVFVGSGLARVPAPLYGAYAPAKAAVRAAAIQLRRELRPRGMFVTYLDPGVVDTEFSQASGMTPQPAWWHGRPTEVAKALLRGVERRAARVNAYPWQTAATVFAEWLPALADLAMASLVTPPATPPATATAPLPAPLVDDTPPALAPTIETNADSFDAAIEPVRRRMERVRLPEPFVRSLLVPGASVELHETAMRWAGMPNKNERSALAEVLEALARAGFLEAEGEDTWRVLRAPS